jgi:peptide/nickel transport system permease protein
MTIPVSLTPGKPVARSGATGVLGSPWLRFAGRRAVAVVSVLVVLVVATFLLVQLIPGDPARAVAGPGATPEEIAQIEQELGLDKPVPVQFGSYVSSLAQGDLGTSFQTRTSVTGIIGDRLPFTVELAVPAVGLVLLVSVPLGMAVAVLCRAGRRRWLDQGFTFGTSLVGAVPDYIVGTLLVLLFAITLGLLPAAGAASSSALILPVLAVAVGPVCALARVARRETTAVLEQDYMRTARGKRLSTLRTYARHALPNLLTSTLTLGGLILTSLLGGTVIVENVFAWPGLGTEIVSAILHRDYPVIQGIVLTLGLIATLINLGIDVLLGVLDPRTLTGRIES